MSKVKGKKMDANFVSSQKWEIQYIADLFSVMPLVVRSAKKKVGRSRIKVYSEIRRLKDVGKLNIILP